MTRSEKLVRKLLQEYALTDDASGVAIPLPLRCAVTNRGNRDRGRPGSTDREVMDRQRAWQAQQLRVRGRRLVP